MRALIAAGAALQALAHRTPRVVDWTPVTDGIHAMLDGTSLFELPVLVDVLPRTGVGPGQARAFLLGGGDMLVAYVASGTDVLSGPSRALLVRLRGADLGPTAGPWRTWIAGLSRHCCALSG